MKKTFGPWCNGGKTFAALVVLGRKNANDQQIVFKVFSREKEKIVITWCAYGKARTTSLIQHLEDDHFTYRKHSLSATM